MSLLSLTRGYSVYVELAKTLASICIVASTCLPPHALAQNWPNKPITIIYPYTLGGFGEAATRVVAQDVSKTLGVPVLIVNKPGAGGRIGHEAVMKAVNDGYTIGFTGGGPLTILPLQDPRFAALLSKFTPISVSWLSENILLVVNANRPHSFQSLSELIAFGKANPGKITFSSGGVGGSLHIYMEVFTQLAGFQGLHIPYKGDAAAISALVGNEVDFNISPSATPFVADGRLRALAIAGSNRSRNLPGVPTLQESGIDMVGEIWTGFVGPPDIPEPIAARLTAAINSALQSPGSAKIAATFEQRVVAGTAEDMTRRLRSDRELFEPLVKSGRIQFSP